MSSIPRKKSAANTDHYTTQAAPTLFDHASSSRFWADQEKSFHHVHQPAESVTLSPDAPAENRFREAAAAAPSARRRQPRARPIQPRAVLGRAFLHRQRPRAYPTAAGRFRLVSRSIH